jgi:hypothetical protein
MDRGFRRGFTAAEKAELWDRWQRGESLKAIGRAFGKPSSSIYFQVAPHGGTPTPLHDVRLIQQLADALVSVWQELDLPLGIDFQPGEQLAQTIAAGG